MFFKDLCQGCVVHGLPATFRNRHHHTIRQHGRPAVQATCRSSACTSCPNHRDTGHYDQLSCRLRWPRQVSENA
jgi:hypothetical protein